MIRIAGLGLGLCVATMWFVAFWMAKHPDDLSGAVALPGLAWTFLAVCVVLPWWAVPKQVPE